VPVLELDDGELLTEGTAIVQYLADQKPEAGLAPPNGTWRATACRRCSAYINSELHKTYSPLFTPKTPTRSARSAIAYLRKRYGFIEPTLEPARRTCSATSSRSPTRTCSR
jgi:glutathione S-transferase